MQNKEEFQLSPPKNDNSVELEFSSGIDLGSDSGSEVIVLPSDSDISLTSGVSVQLIDERQQQAQSAPTDKTWRGKLDRLFWNRMPDLQQGKDSRWR